MTVIDQFLESHCLSKEEYRELLSYWEDKETESLLKEEAVRLRKQYYGNKVYTRGLIEFTNYCKNNCYYCGIRRDNRHIERYRLTEEEILGCCRQGYQLGYRTFVLQGGEYPNYSDERKEHIISAVKQDIADSSVTLYVREGYCVSYRILRSAVWFRSSA